MAAEVAKMDSVIAYACCAQNSALSEIPDSILEVVPEVAAENHA